MGTPAFAPRSAFPKKCGGWPLTCTSIPWGHISGYHMVVAAGVVFFLTRGILALIPGLALRRPIKN